MYPDGGLSSEIIFFPLVCIHGKIEFFLFLMIQSIEYHRTNFFSFFIVFFFQQNKHDFQEQCDFGHE